uniref:Capsid protein n=1 Tax=Torque teno Arctocephalus gazella virus 1 TaxID=2249932 RepID=A0A2Z4N3D7_9VIRU|nr:ORF1 [Torque teno Arctocephalus gazella virus 1]
MVYRRRSFYKRRKPWYRRKYRKWRKPRWRRRHRKWRRHHYYSTVRTTNPKRKKIIMVCGIEPMGNMCHNLTPALKRATPQDLFDTVSSTGQHWSGTWGFGHVTLKGLVKRAKFFWSSFSSDWKSYDYVRFLGGTIYLPHHKFISYMFGTDPALDDLDKVLSAVVPNEATWYHPGWLAHQRGTHIVYSTEYKPCWKSYQKLKVRRPATHEGWYRMSQFFDLVLFNWWWTWFVPEAPFLNLWAILNFNQENCEGRTPWWAGGGTPGEEGKSTWVNRSKYENPLDSYQAQDRATWGPFLSSKYIDTGGQRRHGSLYFKYRLYFQVSGDSDYRWPPSDPEKGYIPPAPNRLSVSPPKRRKKRPLDQWDILPGDLDPSGLLTEEALERITRPCESGERVQVERKKVRFDEQQLQRHGRLRRIADIASQLWGRG